MARRRRFRNTGIPKRSRLFVPFRGDVALVDSGVAVQSADLLLNFFTDTGQEIPVGATIAGFRGTVGIFNQVVGSIQTSVQCFMAKVPESSWSGIPDPGDEIVDAFWYGQYFTLGEVAETAAGTFAVVGQQYDVASEGKRKITATGDEVRFVAVLDSGNDVDVKIAGTFLLMLP